MSSPAKAPMTFDAWYAALQRIAAERELCWMVSSEPAAHRQAYDDGLTPDEELTALRDMSEWRGCGCGGGG